MHAATPVQIGEKWFASMWLWDPDMRLDFCLVATSVLQNKQVCASCAPPHIIERIMERWASLAPQTRWSTSTALSKFFMTNARGMVATTSMRGGGVA
jgi:hypothetical protein